MNVEQSSFSGVVLNVSRLVGIKEIIGSKMFGKSRFNNTFDDFRYERYKYKYRFEFLSIIHLTSKNVN